MDFKIIDAHFHLWFRQDTEVDGMPIRTLFNGRSLFMGEERQMVPSLWSTDETERKFSVKYGLCTSFGSCCYTRVYRWYSERVLGWGGTKISRPLFRMQHVRVHRLVME